MSGAARIPLRELRGTGGVTRPTSECAVGQTGKVWDSLIAAFLAAGGLGCAAPGRWPELRDRGPLGLGRSLRDGSRVRSPHVGVARL
jgi:hypothetical protein